MSVISEALKALRESDFTKPQDQKLEPKEMILFWYDGSGNLKQENHTYSFKDVFLDDEQNWDSDQDVSLEEAREAFKKMYACLDMGGDADLVAFFLTDGSVWTFGGPFSAFLTTYDSVDKFFEEEGVGTEALRKALHSPASVE